MKKENHFQVEEFLRKLALEIMQKNLLSAYQIINEDVTSILKILKEKDCVRSYCIWPFKNTTLVHLNSYDKKIPIIKGIRIGTSTDQSQIVTLKEMQKFSQEYPAIIALVRTQKGIKSYEECLKEHIEGYFVAHVLR